MLFQYNFHPFHMVKSSPWPLFISSSVYFLMISMMVLISNHKSLMWMTPLSFIFFLLSMYGWMTDISNESFLGGHHTLLVQKSLKLSMILFIISEICFFSSMFWSYFYFCLSPSQYIYTWPPTGIQSIPPFSMPLLGTLILISSGVSITHSHMSLLMKKKMESTTYLMYTLFLGISFTCIQMYEYKTCFFSMSDSVYGSSFYILTGFHGIHVILGSTMLATCLYRLMSNQLSSTHHVGYECSIWYWHFVDVVWLFLYIFVYWWSTI